MASVDFMKIHSPAEFKRIARHCDKFERIVDGHRNTDIQKDLTDKNTQLPDRNYQWVCNTYATKIQYLDTLPNANKRLDRVTCFGLEIPCPKDLKEHFREEWFKNVFELICEQYDINNILQYYVHYDEVHRYVHAETGVWQESRVHAHCLVIPEHENRLCGKWFSSRQNMIKLNNAVHEMSLLKYGVEFMDGSKKGSTKRVEQLKRESAIKEYQAKVKEQNENISFLLDTHNLITDKIANGGYTSDEIAEIWSLGLKAYNEQHSLDE